MDHIRLIKNSSNTKTLSYVSKGRNFQEKTTSPADAREKAEEVLDALGIIIEEEQQPRQPELLEVEPGLLLTFVVDVRFGAGKQAEEYFAEKCDVRSISKIGEYNLKFNVFVPDGKTAELIRLYEDYLDGSSKFKKDKAFVEATRAVYRAVFDTLYTGDASYCSSDTNSPVWLQLWIPTRFLGVFIDAAKLYNIIVDPFTMRFVERAVILVKAKPEQLLALPFVNYLAEIRQPTELTVSDVINFQHDTEYRKLLEGFSPTITTSPNIRICIVDTGVSIANPYFFGHIKREHTYTVFSDDPITSDSIDHGTGMAGLVFYGERLEKLIDEGNSELILPFTIESIKIYDSNFSTEAGDKATRYRLYGALRAAAVRIPELEKDVNHRIFVTSLTANETLSDGGHDECAAAVDAITYGSDIRNVSEPDESLPILFIQSIGNKSDPTSTTERGQSPAQSWNALIVGGITSLPIKRDPNRQYSANLGGRSPFSTSGLWKIKALKPDVVFEAGNQIIEPDGSHRHDVTCELLTLSSRHTTTPFATFQGTSAAAALAARFAGRIANRYPDVWPETIRALIVNSADWTPSMKEEFLTYEGSKLRKPKEQYLHMLQHCGWGAPDAELALESGENHSSIIYEGLIHPYQEDGCQIAYGNYQLITLPWPTELLLSLENTAAEMAVTLSYYIEPNPNNANAAYKSRYRYESHGLRLAHMAEGESALQLRNRIAKLGKDEPPPVEKSKMDSEWTLGTKRNRGSIISDRWNGTCQQLAGRSTFAIYPSDGWRRSRPSLNRYSEAVRYSLVVRISVEDPEADIYTPIAPLVSV